MKKFFQDGDNKYSMGRLMSFMCTSNGIILSNIVIILATVNKGDIGSNSMIVIGTLLSVGTGSKIYNKYMENKGKIEVKE